MVNSTSEAATNTTITEEEEEEEHDGTSIIKEHSVRIYDMYLKTLNISKKLDFSQKRAAEHHEVEGSGMEVEGNKKKHPGRHGISDILGDNERILHFGVVILL